MVFKNNKSKCRTTIYNDGYQFWTQNSFLHRLDGPAVIFLHGNQEWWQDGKRIR